MTMEKSVRCVLIDKPTAEAPLGAMWDDPEAEPKGPDGLSLFIQTPAGVWHIDQARPEPWNPYWGRFGRTGVPPEITFRPSIVIPEMEYHGNIIKGELIHCLCRQSPPRWWRALHPQDYPTG